MVAAGGRSDELQTALVNSYGLSAAAHQVEEVAQLQIDLEQARLLFEYPLVFFGSVGPIASRIEQVSQFQSLLPSARMTHVVAHGLLNFGKQAPRLVIEMNTKTFLEV